jgi:hypothetical protein
MEVSWRETLRHRLSVDVTLVSRQFLIEKECTMGINATTTKYHCSIKEWWLHMSTERTLNLELKEMHDYSETSTHQPQPSFRR